MTFPSAEGVTAVTGVLFNGQPVPESYEVDALSGGSTVDSQMFNNMADSFSPTGFGDFSLASTAAQPITPVTITTPNAGVNGWDFLVDTITIATGSVAPAPVPSSALLLLSGRSAYSRRGAAVAEGASQIAALPGKAPLSASGLLVDALIANMRIIRATLPADFGPQVYPLTLLQLPSKSCQSFPVTASRSRPIITIRI